MSEKQRDPYVIARELYLARDALEPVERCEALQHELGQQGYALLGAYLLPPLGLPKGRSDT